jgi:hypothetical protein
MAEIAGDVMAPGVQLIPELSVCRAQLLASLRGAPLVELLSVTPALLAPLAGGLLRRKPTSLAPHLALVLLAPALRDCLLSLLVQRGHLSPRG